MSNKAKAKNEKENADSGVHLLFEAKSDIQEIMDKDRKNIFFMIFNNPGITFNSLGKDFPKIGKPFLAYNLGCLHESNLIIRKTAEENDILNNSYSLSPKGYILMEALEVMHLFRRQDDDKEHLGMMHLIGRLYRK